MKRLTFAIKTIEPLCTSITEVSQLRLALNLHALVPCAYEVLEAILLISSVCNNKILLTFHCILK